MIYDKHCPECGNDSWEWIQDSIKPWGNDDVSFESTIECTECKDWQQISQRDKERFGVKGCDKWTVFGKLPDCDSFSS